MQPYHIIDDGRWAEGRIGTKRCASSYAYRVAARRRGEGGVRLATGRWRRSSPLLGIDAAVNRRTLDGKHPKGWFPEQKITRRGGDRGVHADGSAYAAFQEKDRGSLEVGKLADLVVLSRDILDPSSTTASEKRKYCGRLSAAKWSTRSETDLSRIPSRRGLTCSFRRILMLRPNRGPRTGPGRPTGRWR